MITLFASIVGFVGSVIPEIIKIIKLHKEQNYQLSVLDRQIELKKTELGSANFSQNITTVSDAEDHIQSQSSPMDFFNSTVRPIIAYGFFIMYILVKYAQYKSLVDSSMTSCTLEILWTEDDKAAFASIVSFYFGQRMFKVKK